MAWKLSRICFQCRNTNRGLRRFIAVFFVSVSAIAFLHYFSEVDNGQLRFVDKYHVMGGITFTSHRATTRNISTTMTKSTTTTTRATTTTTWTTTTKRATTTTVPAKPNLNLPIAGLVHANASGQCGVKNVPCEYQDEVDIRIIVITYDRASSLKNCLQSLQKLELDNASVALDIWIDRNEQQKYDKDVHTIATNFNWTYGKATVHIWSKRAGIYGQWIDTWRPKENSSELAVIVEDDTDLSPYFFRWLRKMHQAFGTRPDINGYSLQDENIKLSSGRDFGKSRPRNDPIFMFPAMGTWGFAPHPKAWRKFQDFYHEVSKNSSFNPYVKSYKIFTNWYKAFQKRGRAWTMWSQWYIYFIDRFKLWSVHSNVRQFAGGKSFAKNRREKGLHFHRAGRANGKPVAKPTATKSLISSWKDDYNLIPPKVRFYDWNGKEVDDPLNGQGWKSFASNRTLQNPNPVSVKKNVPKKHN